MTDFVIEAQKIPPAERHAYIFKSFDNLAGGESIVIVNTHNPVPLLRQFESMKADQFEYTYLEVGPVQWQLKITKKKKDGGCGYCGG